MNKSVYEEYERKFWDEFPFMRKWNSITETHEESTVLCEFSDGWLPLMYDLCKEIKDYMESNHLDLNSLHIVQAKEKFGALRVYCDGGDLEILKTIDKYEDKSQSICETCGEPGSTSSSNGWMLTLCKKCRTKP